jgi:type II secretion system protein N
MPPTENPVARWKVVLGYVAFSLFALLFFFVVTFPYDALRQRVQLEAAAAGLHVKIGSLGPGFGLRASNLQLSKKASDDAEMPPEALQIKSVTARPTLFPPGLKISANALGGSAVGWVKAFGDFKIEAELDELDLSQGNLKGFSGMDLAGKVSAELELAAPRVTLPGMKGPGEPDLGQATGLLKLDLRGLQVNGGTVTVAIPMYGPDPTPIDLPKIVIGDLDGSVKFDKGAGTVEKLQGKGPGLELGATGTLKLAKKVEYSEPNLQLRLKAEPDFVKSLGIYGSGLSFLPSDPKDPNWRVAKLTGYLGKPNFR